MFIIRESLNFLLEIQVSFRPKMVPISEYLRGISELLIVSRMADLSISTHMLATNGATGGGSGDARESREKIPPIALKQ